MTVVFISDLHLDDSRPSATKHFLKLLNELKSSKIDKLYILGDLLEYWVGDDDPSGCAKECFQSLKEASGYFDIYMMHGNRDFLLSDNFIKTYKITLIKDPTLVTINRKKIILMHGIRYARTMRNIKNLEIQLEILPGNNKFLKNHY